ncbi:MAG: hypothetical protein LBB17_02700 [Puniceicoccales bacterium]|jgi:hypothetical protein|nr:hypothetical protein [Puniceicoccales bacterium]
MERIPNVNNGQQALDQIPATSQVSTKSRVSTRSQVPHKKQVLATQELTTRVAVISDRPMPPKFNVGPTVSPFAGLSQLEVIRQNGATQTIDFETLLRNGRVVETFLNEIGYNRLQTQNQPYNPNNNPKLSNLPEGLFTLAPCATISHGFIDPSMLFKLFVLNPVALGTTMTQLGL